MPLDLFPGIDEVRVVNSIRWAMQLGGTWADIEKRLIRDAPDWVDDPKDAQLAEAAVKLACELYRHMGHSGEARKP